MVSKHVIKKAKKWLLETGACLILANLYLYSFKGTKMWPLNKGDCLLIQVAFKTGLTMYV